MSSTITHRDNTIAPVSNSVLTPGASYDVLVLEVGAQAAANSSGTTITVRGGHGFANGDAFIIMSSGSIDTTLYKLDASSGVSGNTLTTDGSTPSISSGDILINLGGDTGAGTPNYDAAEINVYTDMDGTTADADSKVTCDASGRYEYWTDSPRVWELIFDSDNTAVDLIKDAIDSKEAVGVYRIADYSTIQAAINAASAAGGGVVLGTPGATYTENIEIFSDVTVDLQWATLKPASDAVTVKFDDADDCVRAGLRNFIIDGSDNKATYTTQDGIQLVPAAAKFHDLIEIENGRIQNCGKRGLVAIGESSSQFVQGLTVRNVKCTSNAQQGIWLEGFVIESNFVHVGLNKNYTDDTTEEAVYIGDDSGANSSQPKRTNFTSCWFNNAVPTTGQTDGPLVHLDGFQELHFDSCLFENAYNYILSDNANNKSLTLTNCLFSTRAVGGTVDYAIKLQKQNGFSMRGCRVTLVATAGLELAATGLNQLLNIELPDYSNEFTGQTNIISEGASVHAKVFRQFTASDTTPSVANWKWWRTNNASTTTITDFVDGYPGQEIVVWIDDANTVVDLTSNTNLLPNHSADLTTEDSVLRAIYNGSAWLISTEDGG